MRCLALLCAIVLTSPYARATVFGQVQGIVHDPQHRPIHGASVTLHAAAADFAVVAKTDMSGAFSLPTVPLGEYILSASQPGFRTLTLTITVASNTSPVLHVELPIAGANDSVTVSTGTAAANSDSATPTILISRNDIATTPGADRTNSLAMITDFVPGAYMTHDMLHMRGGHQVSWLLDGVQVPNTNISGNVGAQIDPKDIDYLEVQRGSYNSDLGDRTYGVFNVVPRNGFERDREGELVITAGNFLQTNSQFNLGDHTERFAWYASGSGSRSDYGLAPPVAQLHHDSANGLGGLASLLYNPHPKDQLRMLAQVRTDFFQIPYDPDPSSFGNQLFDSSGLRDTQRETDEVLTASWLHTFGSSAALQISPFFHGNRANYQPDALDVPVATTSDRQSFYTGLQASIQGEFAHNMLQAGVYGFGQHDSYTFGAAFPAADAANNFRISGSTPGGVVEEYLSDNFRATSWLTLIAGLRQTRFEGDFVESATSPRFGAAVRVPRLNWVFRGFYGHFYQPPPLLTASGPLLQFAAAGNTSLQPLHGERDEEHQVGVQIPLRGWLLDADTFHTRVRNFLDHSNIGDSSIFLPVTVDGARVRAWELALRSPQIRRRAQFHLAYSNQIAEQRGAITGGLVCAPAASAQCDVGPGYTPVDHDQRNTLTVGGFAGLPARISASANVTYGSGFVNGNPDPATPYAGNYLPAHSSVDLAVARNLGEHASVSVTTVNVTNRRVLVDNSLTFGGLHFSDPREIYGEIRYRFHF